MFHPGGNGSGRCTGDMDTIRLRGLVRLAPPLSGPEPGLILVLAYGKGVERSGAKMAGACRSRAVTALPGGGRPGLPGKAGGLKIRPKEEL